MMSIYFEEILQVKSSGDVNVITSESINHTGEEEVEEEVPPVKVEASEHHPPRYWEAFRRFVATLF